MNLLIQKTRLASAVTVFAVLIGCGSQNNSPNTNGGVLATQDSPNPYPVSETDRQAAVNQLVEKRKEMLDLEGKLIAPTKEDLAANADLLKDPNAGLARLFPRGSQQAPLLLNGGGAYYQFKGRTNAYGRGNDVEYNTTNGPTLSVGFAGVDYGFFAQLGKVDIKQVDEKNPIVAFAEKQPSMNNQLEPAWRSEQNRWVNGVTNAGITFQDRTPAIVGMSYVVRSIDEGGYDVVAVFQVLRRDTVDDSLIIGWKLLKELDKPELKRD